MPVSTGIRFCKVGGYSPCLSRKVAPFAPSPAKIAVVGTWGRKNRLNNNMSECPTGQTLSVFVLQGRASRRHAYYRNFCGAPCRIGQPSREDCPTLPFQTCRAIQKRGRRKTGGVSPYLAKTDTCTDKHVFRFLQGRGILPLSSSPLWPCKADCPPSESSGGSVASRYGLQEPMRWPCFRRWRCRRSRSSTRDPHTAPRRSSRPCRRSRHSTSGRSS